MQTFYVCTASYNYISCMVTVQRLTPFTSWITCVTAKTAWDRHSICQTWRRWYFTPLLQNRQIWRSQNRVMLIKAKIRYHKTTMIAVPGLRQNMNITSYYITYQESHILSCLSSHQSSWRIQPMGVLLHCGHLWLSVLCPLVWETSPGP